MNTLPLTAKAAEVGVSNVSTVWTLNASGVDTVVRLKTPNSSIPLVMPLGLLFSLTTLTMIWFVRLLHQLEHFT
jgi:hypothetical protein